MALPISESFTGSNGAAWSGNWTTTTSGGSGVVDIQSNAGRMLCNSAGAYADYCRAVLADQSATDFDIYVDAITDAQESYPAIQFRTDGTWATDGNYPTNGFVFEFATTGAFCQFYEITSGTRTDLTSQVGTVSLASTTVHIRLFVKGTRLKAKIWTGSTEPGTWNLEIVSSLHSARTRHALSITGGNFTGSGTNVKWDNYVVQVPAFPVFQAAGTPQNSLSSITVPWPTHVTDDVALLIIESCGGEPVTLSTPNGFQAITDSPQATGATTNGTQITIFWHRATSASMASPVVADPGNHVYGVILTFVNCITTGNPWDATAGSVKAAASTSLTFPGITTTVANSLVVNAAARDDDNAAAAGSNPANADLTVIREIFDAGTTTGNGGGLMIYAGQKATAGSVTTTTLTVTSSINAMMSFNLKPPSTSGGTTNANATNAVAVGVAQAPTKSVSPNAGTAVGVAVAYAGTVTTSISATAGTATSVATAQTHGVQVYATTTTAVAVAVAYSPDKSISATTGAYLPILDEFGLPILDENNNPILSEDRLAPEVTSVAFNASVSTAASTDVTPDTAVAIAMANAFSVVVSPNAGTATAVAVSQTFQTAISPNAGTATSPAVANAGSVNVTTGTGTATSATSGQSATGQISSTTGTAQAPATALGATGSITGTAGTAVAAVGASNASAGPSPSAGTAQAVAAAYGPSRAVTANAGTAQAVALALEATWQSADQIYATAQEAIAVGLAFDTAVVISAHNSVAISVATAYQDRVDINESTSTGTVGGTANTAHTLVASNAGLASSVASAFNVGPVVNAIAGTATSQAQAFALSNMVTATTVLATVIAIAYNATFQIGEIPKITGRVNANVLGSGTIPSYMKSKSSGGNVRNKNTESRVH